MTQRIRWCPLHRATVVDDLCDAWRFTGEEEPAQCPRPIDAVVVPVDGSGLEIVAAAEAIPQHSFDPSSKGQRMTIAIAVVFAALGIQEEPDVG